MCHACASELREQRSYRRARHQLTLSPLPVIVQACIRLDSPPTAAQRERYIGRVAFCGQACHPEPLPLDAVS